MCREECRYLLEDLHGRKADKEDIEYVKRELELLKELEDRWSTEHKKWWKFSE